jgi:hypothetical protein
MLKMETVDLTRFVPEETEKNEKTTEAGLPE